jgi:hypothetical protein
MNSWGEKFLGDEIKRIRISGERKKPPQSKENGMLEYKNHWNIGIMECWVYLFWFLPIIPLFHYSIIPFFLILCALRG